MEQQDRSSGYTLFDLETLDSTGPFEPLPHVGFDPGYRYEYRFGSMQTEELTPGTDIPTNPTNQLVPGSVRQYSHLTGTAHCKPADLFESQAAGPPRLACPLFLADILTDKVPICNNIAGRHMNEVYDHLVDRNGPHSLFVEACTICKQVVLSPQEKIDHGDSFRRCTNDPFRRKGPQAVQALWGALFRTLAPSIVEIPSAYSSGNSIQHRNSSPATYATSRTVYGQGDTLSASNTLTPPHLLLDNGSETSTSSALLPQRARSPYDSLTSPRPSSPSELTLVGPSQGGMSDDPHLQIRVLKDLLVQERKSRMPRHEQDNAAAQVEAELSQRMQPQQSQYSLVSTPSSSAASVHSLVPSPTAYGPSALDTVVGPDELWNWNCARNNDLDVNYNSGSYENPYMYVEGAAPFDPTAGETSPSEFTVECDNCGVTLSGVYAVGNLLRHKRSQKCSSVQKREYECPQCGKVYQRSDALLNHSRKRHGTTTSHSPCGS